MPPPRPRGEIMHEQEVEITLKNILIIGSDEVEDTYLSVALKRAGHSALVAKDGFTGIKILTDNKDTDLVIIDGQLQGEIDLRAVLTQANTIVPTAEKWVMLPSIPPPGEKIPKGDVKILAQALKPTQGKPSPAKLAFYKATWRDIFEKEGLIEIEKKIPE